MRVFAFQQISIIAAKIYIGDSIFPRMGGLTLAVVVIAVVAVELAVTSVLSDHDISLVVMAPFPDGLLTRGWVRGPSLHPAAEVAAKEVNNRSDVLPGFNLKLISVDSGCSVVSKVTISFLRDIYENKGHQVVGIIGPGCSGAALRVSSLTKRREVSLIHVTPSATSPELEDADKNTTYATISSALSYVQSFIQLMIYNNWNKIATLADEGRTYFKHTHSGFKSAVDKSKVLYTGNLLNGKESVIPLDSLQSSRARVVMVFAGADAAAQLLCYAFHKGMSYPKYQWIFHDRTKSNLVRNVNTFKVSGKSIHCNLKEMMTATEGVILNQFHLEQEDKNKTLPLFQKTYDDYYEDYIEELNGTDPIDYGNSYHDAVWAMALALHNASMSGVDLTSYTYDRNNDTKVIAQYLSQVDFDGVSGPISFQSDTRSVKTVINIKQLQDGEEVLLGTFDRSRIDTLNIDHMAAQFINDTYATKQIKVHSAFGALIVLLTLILFALTSLLHLAHIVWHEFRSIKAISPNISHLMFSGCYLFLVFLIFYSVHESFGQLSEVSFSVLCNVMTWCVICGYSLIFGTLCAKIWRVNRLFKPFRKINTDAGIYLSNNALIMFVILLLCIDLIICVVWNISDPLMQYAEPILNTDILESVYTCNCTYWSAWIGSVVAYKGILVLILMVISIINRRIKMKNFQHTRNVTTLIYSVTLLAGIGFPLYFLLKQESVYFGFVIICTLILSTVTLCCLTIFFPPVLVVLKEKARAKMADLRRRKRSTLTFTMESVTHIL